MIIQKRNGIGSKKLTGIHKLTYKLDADIKHGHNFYDYLITSSDEKNTK